MSKIARLTPSSDARQLILIAAERNFALDGIDAVSVRKILTDAGQRNSSALQYHFGTRERLIDTILTVRLTEVNDIRRRMYDQKVAHANEANVRDLVEVFTLPLADRIRASAPDSFYLRFLRNVFQHPRYSQMLYRHLDLASAGSTIVHDHMTRRLGEMPPALIVARLTLFQEHMLTSLASLEADAAVLADEEWRWRVANVVDVLDAGLRMPPSSATLGMLAPDGDPAPAGPAPRAR